MAKPEDLVYVSQAGEQPVAQISARRNRLTVVFLSVAALTLALLPSEKSFLWDEAVYLARAENLFASAPYYSEPAFSPPLLPLLLYLGSLLLPMDMLARLLAAGFFTCGVLCLYLLGARLYGYLEGLAGAVLMLTSPFFLYWAHKIMGEIPGTALALASVLLLFLHLEDPAEPRPAQGAGRQPASAPALVWRRWSAVVSGILLAAAVQMWWVSGLAVTCALYFLLSRRLKLVSALWYAGAFAAGMAPYLVWARVTHGSFLKPLWMTMAVVEQEGGPVSHKLDYLEGAFQVAGPITLLGLLCYLYVLLRRSRAGLTLRDLPLLLWFVVVYLIMLIYQQPRNLLPAFPALYLLAGRGFSCLREISIAGLTALVVPLAGFYMWGRLDYFQGREAWMRSMLAYSAETRVAALYIKDTLPPDALLYTNHLWPVLTYHSKRKTVALWPRDDRFYRAFPENMKQDGYLVHYRGVEKRPIEAWLNEKPQFRKVQEFQNVVIYSYKYPGALFSDPEFTKRVADARTQFRRGSFDTVIEILALIPIADVEVVELRGWSYYRLGKIPEAAEAFRQGLQAEPDNPRSLTGLGYCELRMGQPQMAQPRFQAVVNQIPDKLDAWIGLGLSHFHMGNKTQAAEAFRKALELAPQDQEVQEYLKKAEEQ